MAPACPQVSQFWASYLRHGGSLDGAGAACEALQRPPGYGQDRGKVAGDGVAGQGQRVGLHPTPAD